MPLLKMIFTKMDNGSSSKWEIWNKNEDVQNGSLFSMGQVYVKAERQFGYWRLFYRMGSEDMTLPKFFKLQFQDQEALKLGIDKFADWAYDNQIRLLEAHERYCDKI